MAQAWFRVPCPRWLRLVLRLVLRPWALQCSFLCSHGDTKLQSPSGVPSVVPTCSPSSAPTLARSSAPSSVSSATRSCSPSARDRPMAQAWFRVACPRRLRLVLRPWRPLVPLPVFPPRLRAAVPARNRPRDRPMTQAWFRVACPRWLRLVLRPVLRYWRPPVSAPSSVSTATPSCSPSAGPTAGPSYGPSLVPSAVPSVAPTCLKLNSFHLKKFCTCIELLHI